MNQYEPVIKVYFRGSTFIEEKPMDQALVNKFWIKVNEAASMPNPPFSQKLIDEAKKKCQNMLNPNVPEFQPQNTKSKLYQQVVEGARQQNLHLTKYIESQNVQEAEDVYQNHSENYNCQTDMQNGFASSDEENLTPSESAQWLEGQEVTQTGPAHQLTQECYNPYNTYYQSYFEDFYGETDMNTGYSSSGYSSSDEENLTPTKLVQWMEQQEVTEGCYNPYTQNQVNNVWVDNYYLSTQ